MKRGVSAPYEIVYAPSAERQLRGLSARDRTLVADQVDRQLSHEPKAETRNRHAMRSNPLAGWELRLGRLRVYYDVQDEPEPVVSILAIGRKDGNRVVIGGKTWEL